MVWYGMVWYSGIEIINKSRDLDHAPFKSHLSSLLGLDIAYRCTKYDHYSGTTEAIDYSFSRSRDMVGAHQNLNGSRELTTPLSGIICQPWANHYKDMKGGTKYHKWGGLGLLGVTQGH